MELGILLIVFIFGIIFGSFFNVLIDRLPRGESPFKGRSHCDHCGRTISVADLVPILSYVRLNGKCRQCRKRLSIQYPLVEIFSGLLFAAVFLYVFTSAELDISNFYTWFYFLSLLITASSFLVIFITDLKYHIIPDELIIGIAISAIIYNLLEKTPLASLIIGSIFGFGLFLLIYLVTKGKGMGFGDVKLALVLGILLGFPAIITGIYIAFLTGGAVSLILILLRLKKFGQQIAFGPFLILGGVVSFFMSDYLVAQFLNYL